MSREHFRAPAFTQETRRAATACLWRIADDALSACCASASPRRAVHAIAACLQGDGSTRKKAWVVGGPESPESAAQQRRNTSAWPLWFGAESQPCEKPLLYLLHASSVAGLRAVLHESAGRGIFCNDAPAAGPGWSSGVQTAVALWLSGSAEGTPYDPASGAETLAILRAALHALYVEGEPGFFYFSAHGEDGDAAALSPSQAQDAFRGMYRVGAPQALDATGLRLLGSGKSLALVRRAADLLQQDWGIACEVWSCPSYTRLAREGREAERWNMLHPQSKKKVSHLHACLADGRSPIVAVTGYAQHIASQIGGFVPARFVALGADSHPQGSGLPDARWIAAIALKALGDEGAIPLRRVEEALKRYRLM